MLSLGYPSGGVPNSIATIVALVWEQTLEQLYELLQCKLIPFHLRTKLV